MKFLNPEKFLNKKDENGNPVPNTVKITNKNLNENEDTVFSFPAERLVYPQAESREEMEQLCGGADRVLDVFNGFLRDDALKAAKDKIRLASQGEQEDIIQAAIAEGKNFTYVESQKISAAEAKEVVTELRNIAASKEMSDAELAALVRAKFNL